MNFSPQQQSDPPGRIKSILIHLAGAEPGYFKYLSAHNASQYAKIGLSVLVPFILALMAGSYTTYNLQEEPKSQLVAMLVGAVWAAFILIVDVTAMSLMVKQRALPPLLPLPSPPPPHGPRPVYGRIPPAEPAHPAGPALPAARNKQIALVRLSIALVLGLFMSHSLVLLVFKNRVLQQSQMNRDRLKTELKTEQDKLDEWRNRFNDARRVQGLVDGDVFLRDYAEYFRRQSASPVTATTSTETADSTAGAVIAGPYDDDPEITRLQSVLAKTLDEQQTEIDDLTRQRDYDIRDRDKLARDLTTAKRMKEAEEHGTKLSGFSFETAEFSSVLGASTSGLSGNRHRTQKIAEFIIQQTARRDELAAKVVDQTQKIGAAEKRHVESRKGTETALATAKQQFEQSLTDEQSAKIRDRKDRIATARTAINDEVMRLDTELQKMSTTLEIRRKPMDSTSFDVLEETEALFDIAAGRDAEHSPTRQSIVIGLILLTLGSLMLIDISPLLFKLTKAPSEYDDLLTRIAEVSATRRIFQPAEVRAEAEVLHPPAVTPPAPRQFPPPPRSNL